MGPSYGELGHEEDVPTATTKYGLPIDHGFGKVASEERLQNPRFSFERTSDQGRDRQLGCRRPFPFEREPPRTTRSY